MPAFLGTFFTESNEAIKPKEVPASKEVSASKEAPAKAEDLTKYLYLQVLLSKLLFVSFLVTVFYQFVKNYNAKMHQYTLNTHRANSLSCFDELTGSRPGSEGHTTPYSCKLRTLYLGQAVRAISRLKMSRTQADQALIFLT